MVPEDELADCEKTLAGAVLLHGADAFQLDGLKGSDFSYRFAGLIYDAALELGCDSVAVKHRVSKSPLFDMDYFVSCLEAGSVMSKAEYCVKRVCHEALARTCRRAANQVLNGDDPVGDLLRAAKSVEDGMPASADSELLGDVEVDLSPAAGAKTGIHTLDKRLGGLRPGETTYIAARPGEGKSALLVFLTQRLAVSGSPVAVFSAEMTAPQYSKRMLSLISGVPSDRLFTGGMSESEKARVLDAKQQSLRHLPIHIYDKSGLSIFDVRREVARLQRNGRVDIVVIDHFHAMSHPHGAKSDLGNLEKTADGIANFARDTGCHILCAVQMNREIERRAQNSRGGGNPADLLPQRSDMKGTAKLEETGDNVVFITTNPWWRDYEATEDGIQHYERVPQSNPHKALTVVKNRHTGQLGPCPVYFSGSTFNFTDDTKKQRVVANATENVPERESGQRAEAQA